MQTRNKQWQVAAAVSSSALRHSFLPHGETTSWLPILRASRYIAPPPSRNRETPTRSYELLSPPRGYATRNRIAPVVFFFLSLSSICGDCKLVLFSPMLHWLQFCFLFWDARSSFHRFLRSWPSIVRHEQRRYREMLTVNKCIRFPPL